MTLKLAVSRSRLSVSYGANLFLLVVKLIVQKLGLHHFILYAHGPDLSHDLNIKHALANCFEALMGIRQSYEWRFFCI